MEVQHWPSRHQARSKRSSDGRGRSTSSCSYRGPWHSNSARCSCVATAIACVVQFPLIKALAFCVASPEGVCCASAIACAQKLVWNLISNAINFARRRADYRSRKEIEALPNSTVGQTAGKNVSHRQPHGLAGRSIRPLGGSARSGGFIALCSTGRLASRPAPRQRRARLEARNPPCPV